MLLGEAVKPFTDRAWSFEIKFDGYRMLASSGASGVHLQSRNGADATGWFPEVAASLRSVAARNLILDGEVCVLDEIGRSDFDRLHARARRRGHGAATEPVVYCVFDVLAAKGVSVMARPLHARKKLLDPLRGLPHVLVVDHMKAEGEALFGHVLALKLEGLVAKRLDSVYRPGARSADWLKIKRPGAVPAERFRRSMA